MVPIDNFLPAIQLSRVCSTVLDTVTLTLGIFSFKNSHFHMLVIIELEASGCWLAQPHTQAVLFRQTWDISLSETVSALPPEFSLIGTIASYANLEVHRFLKS